MAPQEITVSVVLVEDEEGDLRAWCPEVDVSAGGTTEKEALDNLRKAVEDHIKETGPEKFYLRPVKCMKVKVRAG